MKFPTIYRYKQSEIENILGLTIFPIEDLFFVCHCQIPNNYNKYVLFHEEDETGEYYLCFEYEDAVEYEPTEGLYGKMDGPALIKNVEDIVKRGREKYSAYKKLLEKYYKK